jgi:hypothetical protein
MVSLIPLVVALTAPARAAVRELYFVQPFAAEHVPAGPAALRFSARDSVSLVLELRALSVQDQNRLAPLMVNDYRYDEPNHFADNRVPNVRFEVMAVGWLGVRPASYRVASQGGGASLQYLHVNAWFQLGRSAVTYWLRDRLGYAGWLFAEHWPGTYRIRAFYRPSFGPPFAELVTPPLTVTVR